MEAAEAAAAAVAAVVAEVMAATHLEMSRTSQLAPLRALKICNEWWSK